MTEAPNPVTAVSAAPDRILQLVKGGIIGWLQRWPGAAFAAFLAIHVAVWTALPALLYANLPLDLIEALTYGREWQIGYDKLPPLPWWMVEIVYRLFGSDLAYYALAEIAVTITFIAVWAAARRLVGAQAALVAVLIIDGMHYFQYTAVKFNHDVIQLPLWGIAGFAYHRALKSGRLGEWLLCGLAVGSALWAKYFVVVLAAPLLLFLLFDRDARRSLRTPGPWLGMVLALIVMAPHIVWLFRTHFLPFAYVSARAEPVRGWFDYLWHPLFFAGGQLLALVPSLFIAAPLFVFRGSGGPHNHTDAFDRRIVTLLAFGPAAAMFALIIGSGRGAVTMWGYPLWIFIGLWMVMFAPNPVDAPRLRLLVPIWAAVFVGLAGAFTVNYTFLPSLDRRYRAEFFPGTALAATLTDRFHELTGGKKLDYVIGSMWLGGNIAHYSSDHPRVLIDGLPRRAPWIDLKDLQSKGAVLVWSTGNLDDIPAALAQIAPGAQIGRPFTLPDRSFGVVSEHFGWAVLKPRSR